MISSFLVEAKGQLREPIPQKVLDYFAVVWYDTSNVSEAMGLLYDNGFIEEGNWFRDNQNRYDEVMDVMSERQGWDPRGPWSVGVV